MSRISQAACASGSCLRESVQDQGGNYTRFICIAREPELYPGADKTSFMAVTPPKPGSLYKLLSRFFSLGINLTKLESRPLPEREFEFMFYFDFEGDVESKGLLNLLADLENRSDKFVFLGSYTLSVSSPT